FPVFNNDETDCIFSHTRAATRLTPMPSVPFRAAAFFVSLVALLIGNSDQNLAAEAAVSASGLVIDDSGQPVSGATASLRESSDDDPWNFQPQDVLATIEVDREGRFRFDSVATKGRHFERYARTTPWDVFVKAPGFGLAWKNLERTDGRKALELALEPEALL